MLQPRYPLQFSDIDGPYDGIRDIKENIKQNALFLLNVSPGEWPGSPEIGIGIRRFLFENYGTAELNNIHKTINDQFSKYLPFLYVESKFIEKDVNGNSLIDQNTIKLVVKYNIRPLNVDDFVEIDVSV
jgi:hypothetical protein